MPNYMFDDALALARRRGARDVDDPPGSADVGRRMPWTGTQTGQINDIPATGKRVRVDEMVIFRVVGGKIVEAWEEYDEFGMRRQLGCSQVHR